MTKDEVLKELLLYNKETGIFVWTDKAPHKVIGKVAGSKQKYGHLVAKINGVNHLLHRLWT